MEFPKKVMTITELTQLGFTRKHLERLTRYPTQDFAWKDPLKKNSPFYFDTDRFQKFLDRQIKLQGRR